MDAAAYASVAAAEAQANAGADAKAMAWNGGERASDVMLEDVEAPTDMQGTKGLEFDPFFTETAELDLGEDGEKHGQTSFTERRRVDLRWRHLSFDVGVKHKKLGKTDDSNRKAILRGISGEVRAGTMLAIMGSSGAGKTTLLNMLAGRLTSSKDYEVSGEILVNGAKRNPSTFKRQSAYVEQEDKIFAEVTVYEQLKFAADLRLPKKMPSDVKEQRVLSTIQELGLMKVKDSYVGGEQVRGVSGGEKKRVNVGTELVTDPSLLFLDEPTSGLDSFNALNVMYTLRKLASNGRTIVTTIHQPRSNIFSMFDYFCLLAEGQVMFFGPAQDAVEYFARLHFRCPERFNPADYFVDLVSVDPRNPQAEGKSRARIEYFAEEFEETKKTIDAEFSKVDSTVQQEHQSKYASNWFHEYSKLTGRVWKLNTREKIANTARFGQTIFFSVLLGLIWLNNGRIDWGNPVVASQEAFNIGGIVFFISINQAFAGVFNVLFVYPLERSVVLKERASGTYRVSAYVLARMTADFPRTLLQVLLFVVIIYFMVGFRSEAGPFFVMLYVVFMTQNIAEGLTFCISTVLPDPQAASAIVPVFIILSMLFGGFLINPDAIYDWISWIRWVSFINYAFQTLIINQFGCGPECGEALLTDPFTVEISLATGCLALLGFYVFFRVLWYTILRLTGPKLASEL
ncbi:ABC transporter G family member 22 [Porphyridium purpureum]|uniref:Probable ATP-dependent transporter ycf16 n=1 Tax=Porphyridium purpureum TaxID=35688 RepID=A0A5J4Z5W8_PORPP|nr:ABC transporter G family member 22 [Porphyridium purpureum]|eukprot:POR3932..scf295_1